MFCFPGDDKSITADEASSAFAGAADSNLVTQAGQTVFIPSVAHVSGANNTDWRSDVEVKATGDSDASYEIALFERDHANTSPLIRTFDLAAGHSVRYADILGQNFDFSGAGALRITVSSGAVIVTSRTYNQTSGGTYGQFIAGALSGEEVSPGQHGRLIQLSQSTSPGTGYRSNLGLVNTTDRVCAIQVDFYRSDASFIGTKNYNLDPFEMHQVDKIFTKVTGAAVDDGYLIVSTATSEAAFFAYGSVVDNATGDPVYVPVEVLSGDPPTGDPKTTSTLFIPSSAHATGVGGTVWRTDLELHNAGSSNMVCTVDLLRKNADNSSPISDEHTVQPGHALRLGDILGTRFDFSGSAALRLRISGGTPVVTSRTYNQTEQGTYGQFISAVSADNAIDAGQQAALIQLTHNRSASSGFRTNIGLLNTTTAPIDLSIDLYSFDGSTLGSVPVHLQPLSFTQVDKAYENVTGNDVNDGFALVSTTTAGGRFLAYASVIDNRTGDPIYIPALTETGSGGDDFENMSPGELTTIADWLGLAIKAGSGDDYGSAFVSVIDNGIEATLDSVADLGDSTTSVTRINQGIEANLAGGSNAGTIQLTYSDYTHSAGHASWTSDISASGIVFGGKAIPFTSATIPVSASKNGSTVVADLSINASGQGASASGSAHIDTSVCSTYPISGSIDITIGDTTSTITYTNDCGDFKISTPGSVGFEVDNTRNSQIIYIPYSCPGGFTGNTSFGFFGLSDGPLSADQTAVFFSKCLTGWGVTGAVSGQATETNLHLDYTVFDIMSGNEWTFTGSYDGTLADGWDSGVYIGTLRVHAIRGECEGDLVLDDKIVFACGMDFTSGYVMCNDWSSCQ